MADPRPRRLARQVIVAGSMKTDKPKHGRGRVPTLGEGDKASARQSSRHAREFVAEGEVDEAAREAARFVETATSPRRRWSS